MTAARRIVVGLAVLAIAVGICWGVVVVGQAHAGAWIGAIVGPARMGSDPPLVETVFYLLIFGPLIVVAIVAGLIDRRNPLAPGARPLAGLGLGAMVGLAGLTVTVLYAQLAGTLTATGPTGAAPRMLLWGFGVVAFQVAAEETYFRGWLQPALVARWGTAAGVIAASLAFGALHIAGSMEALSAISLVNLFLGGLMFGLFAARSGGLAGAFGAHLAWNAAEQLGWGLDPNPGVGSFGAALDYELAGAASWGGSGEGLNGSIGMTVALLAIVAPLVLLSWRRRGAVAPLSSPTTPGSGRSGRAPA